jgi:hypothetical protein
LIDQKIYLIYYIKMSAKLNHTRSITYGDQLKHISTSSSPDTCGKISALYTVTNFTRAIRTRVLGTRIIRNPKKRRFAMQSALRQVIYDYSSDLPRALSIAERALEDQITILKDAYRNEPMTGFKKPDSLEKQEPRLDN